MKGIAINMKTRIISWNVNGLRACLKKGFMDFFNEIDADMFCLQETKLQEGQVDLDLPGYSQNWSCAEKKGYSGTAIFTRKEPIAVTKGIGIEVHDHEGRVLTMEFDDYYLVCVYTPNSQNELQRLDYRMSWDHDFREYVQGLNLGKPVIICGDLNVAHKEIDLKNPKTNRRNAGFTDEEREGISKLLDEDFTDTFRYLYPDTQGAYTWWSYLRDARSRNAGWRIDYFLVSDRLRDNIDKAFICPEIYGSDHCPVGLDLLF